MGWNHQLVMNGMVINPVSEENGILQVVDSDRHIHYHEALELFEHFRKPRIWTEIPWNSHNHEVVENHPKWKEN